MLHTLVSGDKGPLMTFCSFIFGSIFVNIQDISLSIAIVVGVLTIIEKIISINKIKNK